MSRFYQALPVPLLLEGLPLPAARPVPGGWAPARPGGAPAVGALGCKGAVMIAPKPRAISYHRVSSSDQNPDGARDELRRAVQVRDFELVAEIEETGSGARNDRPGWRRVLDMARRGVVDVVVTWKLDRAARSSLDLLTNLQQLNDAGVRFIATSQSLDIKPGGDAMSKLIVGVLAAIAEFERELIVERTRLGLARARKKGRKLGRPSRITRIQTSEAQRLRREGVSWRETARRVGASVSALRRACAAMGPLAGTPEDPRDHVHDRAVPEPTVFATEETSNV